MIKTSSNVQENMHNEHWHDAGSISDLGSPDISLSGTEILAKIPAKKSQVKLVLSMWVCVSLFISWPSSYLPAEEGLDWEMVVPKPCLQKDLPSEDAYKDKGRKTCELSLLWISQACRKPSTLWTGFKNESLHHSTRRKSRRIKSSRLSSATHVLENRQNYVRACRNFFFLNQQTK